MIILQCERCGEAHMVAPAVYRAHGYRYICVQCAQAGRQLPKRGWLQAHGAELLVVAVWTALALMAAYVLVWMH